MPQTLQRVSHSGWFLKPLEFVEMAHHILIFFPSGDYIARQVQTWIKQYRASETSTVPAMERLIEWLPLHLPRQQRTTVVHGDFRSTWHEEGWYLDVESDGKGIWRGKQQLVFPQFTADSYPCTISPCAWPLRKGLSALTLLTFGAFATARVSTTPRSWGASTGSSCSYRRTHTSRTALLSAATAVISLMSLHSGDKAACRSDLKARGWNCLMAHSHICTGAEESWAPWISLCISMVSQLVSSVWGFPGDSVAKNFPASAGNAGDVGSIPELGRCPRGGNGNPLSTLAWDILWTEEPGGLQSMES